MTSSEFPHSDIAGSQAARRLAPAFRRPPTSFIAVWSQGILCIPATTGTIERLSYLLAIFYDSREFRVFNHNEIFGLIFCFDCFDADNLDTHIARSCIKHKARLICTYAIVNVHGVKLLYFDRATTKLGA